MDKKEYNRLYKKHHYSKTRKIITFPLLVDEEFQLLENRALSMGVGVNKLAKEIVVNFLNSNPYSFMSQDKEQLLKEYIRISRGIANNINQIAYKSNLGEYIDYNILFKELHDFELEFKALLRRVDE